MPIPKPLTPSQARSTLAHRLTRKADHLRQLSTKFGLRSLRVFLVWSEFTGEERGEGRENIIARVEILPTPRVSDLTSISRRPYSLGVFPEGSIRVDQVSGAVFTRDMLVGLLIPTIDPVRCCVTGCRQVKPARAEAVNGNGPEGHDLTTDAQTDFWYEVVEDGRGDAPASAQRYRVFGGPHRNEGAMGWAINLELADEATDRQGRPQIGVNTSEQETGQSSVLVDGEGPL